MAMTAKEKREAREAQNKAAIAAGVATELEKLNQQQFSGQSAHPASGPLLPQTRTRQYVVGCKLGVASIALQLSPLVEKEQMGSQGSRKVMEAQRTGPVVILRGTAYPRGTVPDGFPPAPMIVDGAAMNFGIDAEWMDHWLEEHKRDPLVINKLIFACEKEEDAKAIAREHKDVKSGLDPVNPKGDTRMPRSNRSEIDDVTRDDSRLSSRRMSG
jgi:hypothetical protein